MASETVITREGKPPITVGARLGGEALAWLKERVEPVESGGALAVGAISFRAQAGTDGSLRLVAEQGPSELAVALRGAFEAARVRESFGWPADAELTPSMRVAAGGTWRDGPGFLAVRDRTDGADSGWSIVGTSADETVDGEVAIMEVLLARPMFARFATAPPGTRVRYDGVELVVEHGGEVLSPRDGSWLAERLARASVDFDRVEHASIVDAMRADPDAADTLRPRVVEEFLVRSRVARALITAAENEIAEDALYDKAFVRKVATLWKTGRAVAAVTLVEKTSKRDREFAKTWVHTHRDDLSAGKIPERG